MKEKELVTLISQAIAVKDYNLAEKYALKLKSLDPDNPSIHLLLGTIYTRKNEFVKAVDELERANQLDGDNPETLNNLAVIYKNSGEIKTALKVILKAYKLAPDNPDICYNIANIYKETGIRKKAEAFYKKALDLNPALSLAYNNLGTLYESGGDLSGAAETYKRGLKEDPNHPALHLNLGNVFMKQGRFEDAAEEFRKAVRSRPGWVEGLNRLGTAYLKSGKAEEAFHVLSNAYKADKKNIWTLNNMGLVLTELGRYAEAEKFLKEALEIKPDFVNAAYNLGKLQEVSGKGTDAVGVLKSIMARGYSSTDIRLLLSKLLIMRERFSEAYENIRNVLKTDPDNSEGNTLMGVLNVKTGKKKRALARFNKAVEKLPSNLEARYQRSLVLQEAGDFSRSVADLEYIMKVNPDFKQSDLLLAEAYFQTEDYGRALGLFERLREKYPESENILRRLVLLYKETGAKDKALQAAEELVVLHLPEDDSDSVERMERSISLYEEIISDIRQDYEELINRNIEIYLNETEIRDEEENRKEDESLFVEDFPDLDGEVIPIIDFGGIEPIIEVNEEDREELSLLEMEENLDLPDEEEDIETIRAALLHEQAKREAEARNSAAGAASPFQGQSSDSGVPFSPPSAAPPAVHYIPVPQPAVPQVIVAQVPSAEGTAPPVPPKIIINYNGNQTDSGKNMKGRKGKKKPEKPSEPEDRRKNDEFEDEEKSPAELLDYLENLTDFLPEEKKKSFEESDMKLKIESLKAKMSGKPGLAGIIEEKYKKSDILEKKEEISKDKIESTFKFMNNLTEYLPDKSVGSTIKNKINRILEMMKESNGKGKTT